MSENIVVLMTAAKEEEAARLAKILVEARLAACVSLVPQARSFFWWEGKIDEQRETLMLAKTRRDVLPQFIETVQKITATPCQKSSRCPSSTARATI
jgi:periplasmic divalent cation tolerance protein